MTSGGAGRQVTGGEPAPQPAVAVFGIKSPWPPWLVLVLLGGVWLLGDWVLPVIQDEAYYFAWARHLALGYFDHPPLVAVMSLPALWAHGSAGIARLGTLATAVCTAFVARQFFLTVGLRSRAAQSTALILAFGNVMGLALGIIATPDTVLMLAWVLALHEGAVALSGDDRRWLSAGLATGFGLWAKYMMLLIGPVFLWALIAQQRGALTGATAQSGSKGRRHRGPGRGLRTPWPYLGGLLALAVWTPHLMWNADHDWITLRFQLYHGLATEHIGLGEVSSLPEPTEALTDSPEFVLASPFIELEEEEAKTEKAPHVYDAALKSVNAYLGYYGSQIGCWGGLLAAIGAALWQRRRGQLLPPSALSADTQLVPETRALVAASALTPLVAFGLLALVTHVEANWSAMYLFGAAAWLAPQMAGKQKSLLIGWLVNIGLILLLLIHAVTGIFPTRPHRDRLLSETHGYAELARFLTPQTGLIFADTYQLTAMLNFYLPTATVRQWPGISRDSEFTRRLAALPVTSADLVKAGAFSLVTSEMPPSFAGFRAVAMTELRDCKGAPLQVISTLAFGGMDRLCKQAIHEWYLVRYTALPDASH